GSWSRVGGLGGGLGVSKSGAHPPPQRRKGTAGEEVRSREGGAPLALGKWRTPPCPMHRRALAPALTPTGIDLSSPFFVETRGSLPLMEGTAFQQIILI